MYVSMRIALEHCSTGKQQKVRPVLPNCCYPKKADWTLLIVCYTTELKKGEKRDLMA